VGTNPWKNGCGQAKINFPVRLGVTILAPPDPPEVRRRFSGDHGSSVLRRTVEEHERPSRAL